jgi:hypothetical protein
MRIETTLTRKFYAKHLVLLAFRSTLLYITIASFIGYFLMYFGLKHPTHFYYWFGIVAVSLAVLVAVGLLIYSLYFVNNRDIFFSTRLFDFREDEVSIKVASWEWVYNWDAFQSWEKQGGGYILYHKNKSSFVIPISDIPYYEVPDFEALLRKKIDQVVANKIT